jgi:hypothetical protein
MVISITYFSKTDEIAFKKEYLFLSDCLYEKKYWHSEAKKSHSSERIREGLHKL